METSKPPDERPREAYASYRGGADAAHRAVAAAVGQRALGAGGGGFDRATASALQEPEAGSARCRQREKQT